MRRSALVTSLSTAVINAASAAAAILIAHRFGRGVRTDGFFLAYAVYLVMTLAASAFRVVVVPPLTRAREAGRLGHELGGYALALGLVAAPAVVAAAVVAATVSGSRYVDSFAAALPWFVAAGVLQLFAGLAASALAAFDEYTVAAAAYALGAAVGVGLFAALISHGLKALMWGQALNGCVSLALPAAALALRRVGRLGGGRELRRRLWTLARGAAVPVALQALFAIASALAGRLGSGETTTFSYAFFFASFLVAVTASALSLVSSAPLTRRGLSPDTAAAHVVNTSWLSLVVIAGAVGVFALVGERLVAAVLGSAYRGGAGHELARLVVFFAPWTFAMTAVTVAFPLLFVAERPRVLLPLAICLPLLEVPLGFALSEWRGLDGLALSMALSTLVALAVLAWGLSPRTLRLATRGLARVAVVVCAVAALSFGVLGVVLGGIPAAVVGGAAYLCLLALALPLGLRDAWAYVHAL